MEEKHRTRARSLVNRLTYSTNPSSLSSTLSEIRSLSKDDPSFRSPLAEAGAVPLLTNILFLPPTTATDNNNNNKLKEHASAALLNLSISSPESLMSTPNLLSSLTHSLQPNSPATVSQHAAATLYSLLSLDAYRPIIGSKHPLISSLISLLTLPNSATRTVKDSLKALFGIALYPLNRAGMVELGVVPALFSVVVGNGERFSGVVEDATAVVAQVAGCYESVDAFRKVAGVRILVELVGDCDGIITGRTRENAVSALLNLAMSGGEKAVGDIKEIENAESVVREVKEGGSERGKSKAEALLGVLVCGRKKQECSFSSDYEFSCSSAQSSSSMDGTSF